MSAIAFAIGNLLHTLINISIWVIIIYTIVIMVQPNPSNPTIRQILFGIYRFIEPIFAWIRKKMPFLIINGIDLSPLVLILGLDFLDNLIIGMFFR